MDALRKFDHSRIEAKGAVRVLKQRERSGQQGSSPSESHIERKKRSAPKTNE